MSELVSDAMVDAYLLTLDGELPTRDPGFDAKFIRAREFLEKLVRASPELSLSLAREQRLREILDALTLAAGRYERAMLSGEATFRTMERGLHLAGLEAAKAYHALSSVPDGEQR